MMFVIGIQCGAGELYVLIWSRAVSLLDLPSVLLADWLSFGQSGLPNNKNSESEPQREAVVRERLQDL